MKVRTAGFEPALSRSRDQAALGARRNTRLSYVLFIKSAQRELNPRFLHGEQVGFRRPLLRSGARMGALRRAKLSMNQSTGRDSNSRRRITGAVSSPSTIAARRCPDQCNHFSGTRGT